MKTNIDKKIKYYLKKQKFYSEQLNKIIDSKKEEDNKEAIKLQEIISSITLELYFLNKKK